MPGSLGLATRACQGLRVFGVFTGFIVPSVHNKVPKVPASHHRGADATNCGQLRTLEFWAPVAKDSLGSVSWLML